MNGELYKTDKIEVQLHNGILYAKYNLNQVVDLETAKQIVRERTDYTSRFNRKFPILLDVTELYAETTREARSFFASEEAAPDILAGAILTDKGMNRMAANFFYYISKPKVPTCLFSPKDKDKAIQWLRKMEKKLSTKDM